MASAQTVLIVEDDASIRRVVELALSRVGGFRTLTACDGEAALPIAAREQPDLILLDVMLPKLDGPATLQRLRSDDATRGIPVIFMTARTQAHEREHYEQLGALGTIAKPFDPMALPQQIRALWDRVPATTAAAPPSDDLDVEAIVRRRTQELMVAVRKALDSTAGPVREQAIRLAHQLAGSAGTFGAPQIGQLAGEIERALTTDDDTRVPDLLVELSAEG